ncbi:LamG-like jellyroll fold domain-containing protein [Isosphaeraceae bacterium EP7]
MPATPTGPILLFNGHTTKIEIPSRPEYSLAPRHTLTVSAWIRPDTLEFPHAESTGYVHWMGKGESGRQEWAFRMYCLTTTDRPPRPNRTSFYVFNPAGNRGTGSYEQETDRPGEWMHLVGVADAGCTHFHKNGRFRDCDVYREARKGECVGHPNVEECDASGDPVEPEAKDAMLRIGTRDGRSHFLGAIARVRIWQRLLSDDEITALYASGELPPGDDLVAEFLLNEGMGDQATDSSRLANHGQIIGGTWGAA